MVLATLAFHCGPELRTCEKGCVNGAVCDTSLNVCVHPRPDSGTAGGTGGGATGGGTSVGGGGGANGCMPGCPASMECVSSSCAPRYDSLVLRGPARVGRLPVVISADLHLVPGRSRADPARLELSIDGGALRDDAGTAVTAMQLVDAGLYESTGSFPAMEGPWQVRAAYDDAGLSGGATTQVDLTPPFGRLVLSAPPTRVDLPGFTERDPTSPNAFRRSESVLVTIDQLSADTASILVNLTEDGGVLQQFFVRDGGQQIDLWRHRMDSYFATSFVLVTLTDDVGNSVTRDAGMLTITRFKWAHELGGQVTSLALTATGHLVLRPTRTTAHSIVSWTTDGTQRWTFPVSGNALGEAWVALGSRTPNPRAYVQSSAANFDMQASAIGSDDPNLQPYVSVVPGRNSNFLTAPLVVARDDGGEVAYLPTMDRFGAAILHAWDSVSAQSAEADGGLPPALLKPLDNPVTDNATVFVPNAKSLYLFGTDSAGFSPRSLGRFDQEWTISGMASDQVDHVIFNLSDGGRPTKVVRASVSNPIGTNPLLIPLTGVGIAISASSYYFNEARSPSTGLPSICRVPFAQPTPSCVNAMTRGGAPILGAPSQGGQALYVASVDDAVSNRGHRVKALDTTTLAQIWETPASDGGVALPVNLDCARDSSTAKLPGRPGTLYVVWAFDYQSPNPRTRLEALVVDSPGIDGTAKWPMAQHDPRNSNNLLTPLTDFSCP